MIQISIKINIIIGFILFAGLWLPVVGQRPLSESEAIERALRNHPEVAAADKQVERWQTLAHTAVEWQPAQIFHSVAADPEWGVFGTTMLGIQQTFPSQQQTKSRRLLLTKNVQLVQAQRQVARLQVVRQVREIYHHLGYLEDRRRVLAHYDSIYSKTSAIVQTQLTAGEIDRVVTLAALDHAAQIRLQLETIEREILFDREVLGRMLATPHAVVPKVEPMKRVTFSLTDTAKLKHSASVLLSRQQVEVANAEVAIEKAKHSATFTGAIFGQYLANQRFLPGWQVGLNVPLSLRYVARQVEAAALAAQAAEATHRAHLLQQSAELTQLLREQEKYEIQLNYYETKGKALAAELLQHAELNFTHGKMDFSEFVQLTEQAMEIELNFIENLYGLNLTVLAIQALIE